MRAITLPSYRIIYDRNKRASADKAVPLVVELYHEGIRKFVVLGIKLYPHQWNGQNIVKHIDAPRLNKRLGELRLEIQDILADHYRHPAGFSLEEVAKAISIQQKRDSKTFLEFARERMVQRGLRESTIRQHIIALNALETSSIITSFADLTPSNILSFDTWLRSSDGLGLTHQTTIHGYHKRIKVYVNEAVQFGYLDKSPYDKVKIQRGQESKIKYLRANEVEAIRSTLIEDETLERTRQLFVVQLYTGLAYSDLYAVDWANAERRADGRYYIRQSRLKTNEEYYIVLLPPVIEVLESCGWILPKIGNAKYNVYLKGLGIACGIKTKLTSHVARHTFATTITLSNKVPIEIVAKMMGHADIKTTQKYAKVLAEDVIDAFVELEGKI